MKLLTRVTDTAWDDVLNCPRLWDPSKKKARFPGQLVCVITLQPCSSAVNEAGTKSHEDSQPGLR